MDKYKIIFSSSLSFAEKIKKAEELAKHEIQKTIGSNVKTAFKEEIVWSEFTKNIKEKEEGWKKHVVYYYGNIYNFDSSDWRFSEVKGKREKAVFEKLVLHKNTHGLKQNHINDYNDYLDYVKY